jgi:hypothetical protein
MSTQNYLFIQVTDEFTDHSSTSGNTKILAASNSRQLRTKPSPFIHGHKRVQHLFTEEAALLGFLEITLHDWDLSALWASRRIATHSRPIERFCFVLLKFVCQIL